LGRLQNYLQVDPRKLKAKGVESVRSRVCNLSEFVPELDTDIMLKTIRTVFEAEYGAVEDLVLTPEQVAQIEAKVNEEISKNHDVSIEFMPREQAADIVDLSKLPEDASETLRIVRIGDYDACACIGAHVRNTSEIGTFRIISHSYADGVWRLRWKVIQNQ
jgi:Ser-tRNA(Ala) deacylase AlaX